MSLILLFGEAVVFAAVGALIVSPWPFWMGGIVLIGVGVAVAIKRDNDTGREAIDDYRRSETLRRQYLGEWR